MTQERQMGLWEDSQPSHASLGAQGTGWETPEAGAPGKGRKSRTEQRRGKEPWQVCPGVSSGTRRRTPFPEPSLVLPLAGTPGDFGPSRPERRRGSATVQEQWVLGQNPSPP